MDNSTLTIMEQRVAGLRATLDGLREDERLFQRAAGLKVQQEKDHTATLELEARLTAGKKELAELLDQKARAMQTTATALAQKMGQIISGLGPSEPRSCGAWRLVRRPAHHV